jgi:predicted phosphodiesterase
MRVRSALAIVCVLVATFGGGLAALWTFSSDHRLSAGRVSLSVDPFHQGALDLYVPLVDWGVRFKDVRMPARLHVDVRAIDRAAVADLAQGGHVRVEGVRGEARDAIADYLRKLVVVVGLVALALGALTALAVRSPRVPRLRLLFGLAGAGAALWMAAVAVALPPRGRLDNPDYYARGTDIPVALRAVEDASRSAGTLSEELDDQLVGLARLVEAPGARRALGGLPRLTIASDLHNNVLALPTLRRAAARGPVLFPGDLTDSGTPLETRVVRRVVRTGRPFVFTAGNHDSDRLSRSLARAGAIVLTQRGRLLPGRRHGPMVVRVAGLRVAGYTSPNVRHAADGYRDRGSAITPAEQADFLGWLTPLVGHVDVVMVHEPQLVAAALHVLRADPPAHPLVFAVGHTHRQAVDADRDVAVVNGGTVGAGGTSNLGDGSSLGLAVLTYSARPFRPFAADLVRIDPGNGSAAARRVRLDQLGGAPAGR